MTTQHLTTLAHYDPGPLYRGKLTRRTLQKARMLDISPHDLYACTSLEDIQRLAKQRYYRLAPTFHPDTRVLPRTGPRPQRTTGFQRIARAYAWFLALTELPTHWELETVHEGVLPGSMERRPVDYGYGWNIAWW